MNRAGVSTEETACLAASLPTNTLPPTSASIPDKNRQTTCRQESWHQTLLHTSIWVQCSCPQHMLSFCQFDKTTMIPMSRSEVDALRQDECLQLMEQLGEAQPRRVVLVVELKAMTKDLVFSREGEQKNPHTENHTSYTAGKTERPRLPGQAQSQDAPGGSASGPRTLPLGRSSGGSAIPLETQEVGFIAAAAGTEKR